MVVQTLTDQTVVVERIGRHYDDAVLSFSGFHAASVAMLKGLPPWARHWDAECGVWRIHPGYADRVAESLRRLGVRVTPRRQR
jgi:hypothetical protein